MLDHVGQLADVARPGVLLQRRQRLGREDFVVAAGRGAVAEGQVPGQEADVVDPLAQRRQGNLEGVDAEPEVLAELARGHHRVQAAIRGADDADVAGERFVVADAADLAAFQEPQQLRLHRLGQLADFVEEERAAVGHLEQARCDAPRPR